MEENKTKIDGFKKALNKKIIESLKNNYGVEKL